MTDDPRPGFNALRDKMLQHLEVHRTAKLEDLAQAAATFAYEALYLPGSSDVPYVQRTAPRRIYLCVSDDLDDRDEPFPEEVTWAADEAISVTVPYVRADLVNAGTAVADERAAFESELQRMPDWAPEFEQHRPWVEHLLWNVWQTRAALAAPKAEAWQYPSAGQLPEPDEPVFCAWTTHQGGFEYDVARMNEYGLWGDPEEPDDTSYYPPVAWQRPAPPTSPAPQEESK